jgi:hypothetical protein
MANRNVTDKSKDNPQRCPHLLSWGRPRHFTAGLPASFQRLRHSPLLVRKPHHRLAADQLQRHMRHLPLLAPRPQSAEHQPRLSALQINPAARRRIPWNDLHHRHGFRGRVSGVFAGRVGRADVFV